MNTVVLSFAIADIITSFIVTIKSSVVAEVFTSVNSSVVPSPTNLSAWISSSKISKGTNLDTVADSILSLSVVIVESSSVPISSWKPPPTILTKPVAIETSVSTVSEVNVSLSPSSYNEPASSTIISLTEPLVIPSTTIVAFSLPTASIVTTSWSVCKIPSLTTTVDVMNGWTVNVTVTSLEVDIPVIVSASVNVPSIGTISNTVTESL